MTRFTSLSIQHWTIFAVVYDGNTIGDPHLEMEMGLVMGMVMEMGMGISVQYNIVFL